MTTTPTTATEPPSPRPLALRRNLPSGRALVGALLITVAAVGSFAIGTRNNEGPNTEYVVMRNDVAAGDTIGRADLTLAVMTLAPEVAATSRQALNDIEEGTALQFLQAGTLLDPRDVRPASVVDGATIPPFHELTIPVPRSRSPRALRSGDRVTLLAFDSQGAVLRTAIEDALVLEFDTNSDRIGADEARLTMALPSAESVVEATRWSYDSLTVVLTSQAIDDEYLHSFPTEAEPTADAHPDAAT